MRARAGVAEFRGADLDYSDLNKLMISEEAWAYAKSENIDPCMVFAHPDIFRRNPGATLYYRGMALLSLKDVNEVAAAVHEWEDPESEVEPKPDAALKVARICNYVNSGIITSLDGWTLEDGYRNILATVGITHGGREAED